MEIISVIEKAVMDLWIRGVNPKIVLVNQNQKQDIEDYFRVFSRTIKKMGVSSGVTEFVDCIQIGPFPIKIIVTEVENPECYGSHIE